MMFSIVMPLYNKEKYISKAIYSVLNQTIQDFEIIIVDDGSTDNSVDKIEKVNDHRIKLIKQSNSGVSHARNVGIKNAKYPYIAFLDADDVWNIDFLKTIKNLIARHPDASVFYTGYKMFEGKAPSYYKNNTLKNTIIYNYFKFALEYQGISTSTVVIDIDVLKKTGLFNEKLSRGEDLLLWTELALENIIAYSPYIGAFYRRDDSTSLTRTKKPLQETFSNIAEEFYNENLKYTNYPEDFRDYMSNIIITKAKYLTTSGNKKEARHILDKYITKNNFWKANVMRLLTYLPTEFTKFLYN